MTREESADALKLILTGIASPAQIGAFMIAHRIRRPEPQELAGMLDTYLKLGPQFFSNKVQRRPICFGMPFDGRKRTAPIYPLTTLVLLSAGQPVVLQGAGRMPVKYGITINELFLGLGLNLSGISIDQMKRGFFENGFAYVHQPDHFPLAENLIQYREEIGKRPPIASMELLWTAHQSEHLLISGFVHAPTEERHWKTLKLMGEQEFLTIKGLEGSTDLSIGQTCIIGHIKNENIERLKLNAKNNNYSGKDMAFTSFEEWQVEALKALENIGSLTKSVIWNSGFYLWKAGITRTLEEGIKHSQSLIESGSAKSTLKKLIDWRENII